MMQRYIGTAVLVLSAITTPLIAQRSPSAVAAGKPELIARGKYLVERVGMCQDCHTPINEKGQPERAKWLQGAPIPFKPAVPIPAWAEHAVRIAGLPGWTDEQAITFLMTGKDARGASPRPPMPGYRFNRKDAMAITAYLRSLGTEVASGEPASVSTREQK